MKIFFRLLVAIFIIGLSLAPSELLAVTGTKEGSVADYVPVDPPQTLDQDLQKMKSLAREGKVDPMTPALRNPHGARALNSNENALPISTLTTSETKSVVTPRSRERPAPQPNPTWKPVILNGITINPINFTPEELQQLTYLFTFIPTSHLTGIREVRLAIVKNETDENFDVTNGVLTLRVMAKKRNTATDPIFQQCLRGIGSTLYESNPLLPASLKPALPNAPGSTAKDIFGTAYANYFFGFSDAFESYRKVVESPGSTSQAIGIQYGRAVIIDTLFIATLFADKATQSTTSFQWDASNVFRPIVTTRVPFTNTLNYGGTNPNVEHTIALGTYRLFYSGPNSYVYAVSNNKPNVGWYRSETPGPWFAIPAGLSAIIPTPPGR